jgi:molybdopterin-guanine dinucleotide biosynthesis protein B
VKAVAFIGRSGIGKTTLMRGVIGALKARGLRVSAVKHARRGFDIDQPGKDSHAYREAGAYEVVVASSTRLAKVREYLAPGEPTVHQLLAELVDCDWALVEGFPQADVPKIEVWRPGFEGEPMYPDDPFVLAVACAGEPPVATLRSVLPLDDAAAVADWLVAHGERMHYDFDRPR